MGNGNRFPPTRPNVLKMNAGRSRNGLLANSKKAHHSLGILLLLFRSATTLRGLPQSQMTQGDWLNASQQPMWQPLA